MSLKQASDTALKTFEEFKKKSLENLRAGAYQVKRAVTRPYYTEKLIEACFENGYRSGYVRDAVKNGADVNVLHPTNDQSLLMLAARREDLDMMQFALAHGARINQCNSKGQTALMMAMPKKPEIAAFLIENGADISAQSRDGRFVVDWASLFGRDDQVKMLLDKRAPFSDHALRAAVVNGQTRCVKLLLAAGADVHAQGIDGERMLVLAAKKGFVNMVDELLKKETDMATIYQALQVAVEKEHLQTIATLKKALKQVQDNSTVALAHRAEQLKNRGHSFF